MTVPPKKRKRKNLDKRIEDRIAEAGGAQAVRRKMGIAIPQVKQDKPAFKDVAASYGQGIPSQGDTVLRCEHVAKGAEVAASTVVSPSVVKDLCEPCYAKFKRGQISSTALPEAADWKEEGKTKVARNWLSFLRIHTSNLTQVGALLGPVLAGVTNIPLLIIFAAWGLLYHAWGFTDNNIQDYEFDVKDPAKQHFALVRGAIPLPKAKLVNRLLFVGTLVLGLVLTYPITSHPTAFAFLILSITAGLLYNRTCKRSLMATLYIVLAFTSISLFTYFTQAETFNVSIIFVAVYTILLMAFQIGYEGYLKDFGSDPVNLLRHWGARIADSKIVLGKQKFFWLGLKIGALLLGLWFIFLPTIETNQVTIVVDVSALLFMLLFIVILVFFAETFEQPYDNKKETSYAAKIEILTYFALIIALTRVIGVYAALVLLVYPIAWFIALNYATWKTLLRPKV